MTAQSVPDTSLAIDTRFLWTLQHKRLLTLEREDMFGEHPPGEHESRGHPAQCLATYPVQRTGYVVRPFLALDMLEPTAIMGFR